MSIFYEAIDAQLRSFIEYKAALVGVIVVAVDPRNTSRTCPACGHVDKANRVSQSRFLCAQCGCAGLADHFAAVEISRRASAMGRTEHLHDSSKSLGSQGIVAWLDENLIWQSLLPHRDGCELAPKCLECPFMVCKWDVPQGQRTAELMEGLRVSLSPTGPTGTS